MGETSALVLHNVSRSFGATKAVRQVSIAFEPATVHALVGENGAGKSTLGKIIAGVISPDSGEITLNGRSITMSSPIAARTHGIAMVAQELILSPNLSAAENVLLGMEKGKVGFVDKTWMNRRFDELVEWAGFSVPRDKPVREMSTSDQQKVEILKALARNASTIVMDEPTAALDSSDVKIFHKLVKRLAANGTTVILISHFLTEVLELSDDISVMRDGEIVETRTASDFSVASLVEAMLGRSLSNTFPERDAHRSIGDRILEASQITNGRLNNAYLYVRAGEIVGIGGLAGSGRSELIRAIGGVDPIATGNVRLRGQQLTLSKPGDAIAHGILTIHESRKEQGLFLDRSLSENTSLNSLGILSRLGFIRKKQERQSVNIWLNKVTVKFANVVQPVSALSGGNQQKVLFARLLMKGASVFIADEPTRGVDIGAKASIYSALRDLANSGVAVAIVSSEIEELLGLCDRIFVMRHGKVSAVLVGERLTEEEFLKAAFSDSTSEVLAK